MWTTIVRQKTLELNFIYGSYRWEKKLDNDQNLTEVTSLKNVIKLVNLEGCGIVTFDFCFHRDKSFNYFLFGNVRNL